MIHVFYVFLLYVRLATGQVIENTGAWAFTCNAYNDSATKIYTAHSARWVDGVDAAAVVIPSTNDFILHCWARVGDAVLYMEPAVIEDHDHLIGMTMPLYLSIAPPDSTMILQQPARWPRILFIHADVQCAVPAAGYMDAATSPIVLHVPAAYEYFPEIPGGERTYWANVPRGCVVVDVISSPVKSVIFLPIVYNIKVF